MLCRANPGRDPAFGTFNVFNNTKVALANVGM